jgi:ribulose-phosphate 3-epimerase
MQVRIAPSILSVDFGRMEECVKAAKGAGCDMLHIDVMDGHFVPNVSVGTPIVSALRKMTDMRLDVHLMVEDPKKMFPWFKDAGADILTFHIEAEREPEKAIALAHDLGVKVGVTINPPTLLGRIQPLIDKVDMVLIMSVNPGFAGQKFIQDVLPKVHDVREAITRSGQAIDLEIDGGITHETAPLAVRAGANVLVAGSAVFGKGSIRDNVKRIMDAVSDI